MKIAHRILMIKARVLPPDVPTNGLRMRNSMLHANSMGIEAVTSSV
jgi:hypothetical protein